MAEGRSNSKWDKVRHTRWGTPIVGVDDFANEGPTLEQRAQKIFNELDNNPELMREFNLILRRKKLERIKDKK